jgi:hypothetical protein
MIKRRVFLGGALGAVALASPQTKAASAAQHDPAAQLMIAVDRCERDLSRPSCSGALQRRRSGRGEACLAPTNLVLHGTSARHD